MDLGISGEPIYSPKIRLRYHPPPDMAVGWLGGVGVDGVFKFFISIYAKLTEFIGIPLYSASAVFVRHALNALYADLGVELRKVTVHTPSSSPPESSSRTMQDDDEGKKRHRREKSVFIGAKVAGKSRVSGSPGEWEV